MTWKSYTLVSGVGVIATYLVSAPPTITSRAPARAPAAHTRAASDIQELAVRLQARVQAETTFRRPARNPFRFIARPQPAPVVTLSSPLPVAEIALPPALPPVALLGMAVDDVDGVEQRTAIVKTASDVVLVRVGDAVEGGYTVSKIEEGAIELRSTADGAIRRISFTP